MPTDVAEPAITALMPVKHFDPDYLEEALRSLADQTDPTWRLLIIVEPSDVERLRGRLRGWLGDYFPAMTAVKKVAASAGH